MSTLSTKENKTQEEEIKEETKTDTNLKIETHSTHLKPVFGLFGS